LSLCQFLAVWFPPCWTWPDRTTAYAEQNTHVVDLRADADLLPFSAVDVRVYALHDVPRFFCLQRCLVMQLSRQDIQIESPHTEQIWPPWP
jgi:hypothetical protein